MGATRFSKVLTAAATSAALLVGAATTASAAILTGTFDVSVYQRLEVDRTESEATEGNVTAAGSPVAALTYTGALDFSTNDQSDSTTIADWFSSNPDGASAISSLTGSLADTLSTPNIDDGSALATFIVFSTNLGNASGSGTVTHDDGFTMLYNGAVAGSFQDPTSKRTTSYTIPGGGSGDFELIYVATNGDPSILQVSAVPVPAAGLLLLTALAGGAAVAHRRRKAS